MEIYFISFCIGMWQLGSIVSYLIHLYCSILVTTFDVLASIGITEPTEAQCNRVQAKLVGNFVITIGSCIILVVVFVLQAWSQYKKNLVHASKYIDEKDIPTFSLAWSQDKSKNTRYSHLIPMLTLGRCGYGATSSMGTSFRQTGISLQDSRSVSFLTASSAPGNISLQVTPSHDRIEVDPNEGQILVPVASPISNFASRWSDRNSSIDTPCKISNTTNSLAAGTETSC